MDDPHPMAYDLCHIHGDSMTVPVGWHMEDRRGPRPHASATPEPAGGSGTPATGTASPDPVDLGEPLAS